MHLSPINFDALYAQSLAESEGIEDSADAGDATKH
jgi:preprotein translocase subunit SecB